MNLKPVDFETFQKDFCDNNYTLTTKYFEKIGQGSHERFYANYLKSSKIKFIENVGKAFIHVKEISFVLLSTYDGYIFSHHKLNSQKVTGDFEKDNLVSRNFRKWDEFTVLNLKQYYGKDKYYFYERDTGVNLAVTAVPIYVNGKHWGSATMAYDLETFKYRLYESFIYYILTTIIIGIILLLLLPNLLKRILNG